MPDHTCCEQCQQPASIDRPLHCVRQDEYDRSVWVEVLCEACMSPADWGSSMD